MIPRVKILLKNDKGGFEEVTTLTSNVPTILDYKDFNYDSSSLVDCIYLFQSMINSPHAYEQNKALLNILLMLNESFGRKVGIRDLNS